MRLSRKIRLLFVADFYNALWQLWCVRACRERSARRGTLRGVDFYSLWDIPWVLANAIRGYRKAHGRYPDIKNPKMFSEKMFWSKFFEEVNVPQGGNKLQTSFFIPSSISSLVRCPEVVWHSAGFKLPGNEEIDSGDYYCKASHGSGFVVKVTYPLSHQQRSSLESLCAKWLQKRYGIDDGEWWYNAFTPEILLQRSVTMERNSISWAFLVVAGEIVQISPNRKMDDTIQVSHFDGSWQKLLCGCPDEQEVLGLIVPASGLRDRMSNVALEIGRSFRAVRVDLMIGDDGELYLGELTLTSGNALRKRPMELEKKYGEKWNIGQWP